MLRERGFGLRMGFGVRPALLVIDMIKAFTDPDQPLGSNLDAQIDATGSLIEAAHARQLSVIFSTVRYDDAELRDAGIWRLKQKGIVTLAGSGTGHEIDPRLTVGSSDSIVSKKYASCFFGTDLVSRLVVGGIDTLLIAGCTTSGCVRATVVDSVQYGFRPMVVREAVGDRSEAAHLQSLSDIDGKYGDVISLAEALSFTNTRTVFR